jgi:hypothetical protein
MLCELFLNKKIEVIQTKLGEWGGAGYRATSVQNFKAITSNVQNMLII